MRTHEGTGNDPHRYRVAKEAGSERTQLRISPEGETEPGGPGSVDRSNHLKK